MDETSAPREGLLPASRPAEPRRPEAAALDGTDAVASLERSLIGLVESSREQSSEDPFRNPVLAVTLAITKQLDRGGIGADDLDALFVRLRARALAERAERLRAYVGLDEGEDVRALPGRLVDGVPRKSGDFESLADLVSRTAFAVVFTAHPTFGMPRAVASRLAQAASGGSEAERAPAIREAARLSTRPDANIRLDDEFDQACIAANNGREALDAFNGALLDAARARWPDRWGELVPRPFAIASWVGCDTDGRTPTSAGGTPCATGSNRSGCSSTGCCASSPTSPPRASCEGSPGTRWPRSTASSPWPRASATSRLWKRYTASRSPSSSSASAPRPMPGRCSRASPQR